MGALVIERATFNTPSEVAASATEAKKMAKRESGNSLFIERRRYPTTSIKPPAN
jgi:hypothetical protein